MHLDESELLVTLVFKDFTKKSDFVIRISMSYDSIDNCTSPLNYKIFKTIFLIKISIEEGFKCLARLLRLLVLPIELDFL